MVYDKFQGEAVNTRLDVIVLVVKKEEVGVMGVVGVAFVNVDCMLVVM